MTVNQKIQKAKQVKLNWKKILLRHLDN
jgi:hypothetical protein